MLSLIYIIDIYSRFFSDFYTIFFSTKKALKNVYRRNGDFKLRSERILFADRRVNYNGGRANYFNG